MFISNSLTIPIYFLIKCINSSCMRFIVIVKAVEIVFIYREMSMINENINISLVVIIWSLSTLYAKTYDLFWGPPKMTHFGPYINIAIIKSVEFPTVTHQLNLFSFFFPQFFLSKVPMNKKYIKIED